MIKWLKDITDDDRWVGGKAYNLAKLMRANFPEYLGINVPNGFVVAGEHNRETCSDAYLALLIAHIELTDAGGPRLAVRSSAVGEDGEEASFAGQYHTSLNVLGWDALTAAIKECQDSLTTARADAYQQHHDVQVNEMGIVIQQMVNAVAAGVTFTVEPVESDYETMCIEAIRGLGDALVSGETTPSTYMVNRATGPDRLDIPEPLSVDQVTQLWRQGMAIEEYMGKPQDIEWAIDEGGTIYVVQSRPITTL